jgi:hypothetical protein
MNPIRRKLYLFCLAVAIASPGGFTSGTGELLAASHNDGLQGFWVTYQWDGEGAPVRLELEVLLTGDERLMAVLRQRGQAPRHFGGFLTGPGIAESASGFRIELQPGGQTLVELGGGDSHTAGNPMAFWRE